MKKHLREAVRRKRLDSWSDKKRIFHRDKVPSHSSLLIRDFSANHEITLVQQLPYSTDLAPVDFVLFLKLKLTLNVRRFGSFEKIKKIAVGAACYSTKNV